MTPWGEAGASGKGGTMRLVADPRFLQAVNIVSTIYLPFEGVYSCHLFDTEIGVYSRQLADNRCSLAGFTQMTQATNDRLVTICETRGVANAFLTPFDSEFVILVEGMRNRIGEVVKEFVPLFKSTQVV